MNDWSKFRGASPSTILNYFNITCPCVKVDKILESLNVKVSYTAFKDVNKAAILYPTKNAQIFINEADTIERQRFSMAHQLCHLLHHDMNYAWIDPASDTKEERQANNFAIDLLIPPKWLYKSLVTRGLSVEEACLLFGVSQKMLRTQWFRSGL